MSTETKYPFSNPEIWGGIECTINRVANVYRDQLAESGHYERGTDINAFATLGIAKMRYPVLWEKHLPDENGVIDWQPTAARLQELRTKNITPIAGLLHHGSGPVYTNLADPSFPEKLAAYAGQVAARFPWLEYYSPVNEPLTTARFSGLYGFWYPHHKHEKSFVCMLLNQVKGIILSMQAIRKINPAARLVQTEDLCKVHSTPALAYQATFENERRWLTCDLLCGRFKPGHALWGHFLSLGITEYELNFFLANSCPPDIMGFNYYVTSERYLDDTLEHYPLDLHGGNGHHYYADTDAARTNKRSGLAPLLKEAWERYRLPMAVTECHLNCSREEQMRWLKETWETCCGLNRQDIPMVAVTAWSLLGSFDWDSLLLQQNGHYESGVFDIRGGGLRATILAKMIHTYSDGQSFDHPLLKGQGWWNQSLRHDKSAAEMPPLVIVSYDAGASLYVEQVCRLRRINYLNKSIHELQQHDQQEPWGIIITCNERNEKDFFLYSSAVAYCSENNISCMFYNLGNTLDINQECTLADTYPILYVKNEYGDSMKLAHGALDLFIDGQKGQWIISDKGARK